MKIADIPVPPPKILLFGPPGSGKTALATTLGERATLFDFDRGFATAKKLQDKYTPDRLKVDYMGMLDSLGQPIGYTDVNPKTPQAWLQFKKDLILIAQSNQAKQSVGKAWIFDSLTTMYECALRFVLANSGDAFSQPQIQHWGISFTEIINMLAIIRTLPGVVIFIAHDQRDEVKKFKEDPSPKQIIEIGMPGKNMPNKICSFFDEVWFMKVTAGAGNINKRVIQTMADPQINVRSRNQLLNDIDTEIGMYGLLDKVGYKFPILPTTPAVPATPITATK